jgi:hypothetical protein
MRPPNPPRRHHYAPVFYLKRWCGDDGLIEQFSRPSGREVKARIVAPGATGYQDDLYAMPGLSPDLVQQVEQRFMQEVDSGAAEVLAALEKGPVAWTSTTRSAWTRFLQSLQLRTPADVEGVKARTLQDWGVSIPKIQETYESMRRLGDPATFEEFMTSKDPLVVERAGLKVLTVLIDAPGMGTLINNLRWAVLNLDAARLDLLTSDRAIEQVGGLGDPNAFVTLPIGPRRLFIAAHQGEIIERIAAASPTDVVRKRNRASVMYAREFVWGVDRSQAPFIAKQHGSVKVPTLGERLARHEDTAGG